MLDVKRIKNVLEYARLWEYDFTVFGSNGHLYCLNTPLDEKEVSAWEIKYGLTLPPDYRDYLTKVGNGFAGPGYGITPFDSTAFEPAWKESCLHAPEYEEEYNRLAKRIAKLYDKDEEDEEDEALYDALEKRFNCDGVLTVGTGGCASINGIALNGSTKGYYLALVSELEYYRAGELGVCNMPFSQWLTEWLEQVEQACSQLTQKQLNRSRWERSWMLDFAGCWREKDAAGMSRLVSEIESRDSVSTKCAGFLYYFSPKKRRLLPGAENIETLRERMGRIVDRQRHGLLPHISCPGDVKYGVAWNPTLEEFVRYFQSTLS